MISTSPMTVADGGTKALGDSQTFDSAPLIFITGRCFKALSTALVTVLNVRRPAMLQDECSNNTRAQEMKS
jgi:hypothetical protein